MTTLCCCICNAPAEFLDYLTKQVDYQFISDFRIYSEYAPNYLSSIGFYDDFGTFVVRSGGNDESQDWDEYQILNCKWGSMDDFGGFLVHHECYKIMRIALKEFQDTTILKVLTQKSRQENGQLDYDYFIDSCSDTKNSGCCDPAILAHPNIFPVLHRTSPNSQIYLPSYITPTSLGAFKVLPNELIHGILRYLTAPDIVNLEVTSKAWQLITQDPVIWEIQCRLNHYIPPDSALNLDSMSSNKKTDGSVSSSKTVRRKFSAENVLKHEGTSEVYSTGSYGWDWKRFYRDCSNSRHMKNLKRIHNVISQIERDILNQK